MSKVIAEVEELRHFAANLRAMDHALNENYTRLKQQMHRINDSWRDQENTRFMEQFEREADVIYKIAEHMNAYSLFIDKKAARLQDYLDTQMGGF